MELAIEVPAEWNALVHPRRDGLLVKAEARPAPGASARLERLVEETSAEVEALVELETGLARSSIRCSRISPADFSGRRRTCGPARPLPSGWQRT